MCCSESGADKKPRASAQSFNTAPLPKLLESKWKYAVSTGFQIGAPLCFEGSRRHHSRSLFKADDIVKFS